MACLHPLLWGLLGSEGRYTDIKGPGKPSFKQCLIHEKPRCAPKRGEAGDTFCLSLFCSGPTSSQLSLHMVQSSCLGVEALRVNKIGTCAPQVHTLGLLWGHSKIIWVFFKHSFRYIDSFALGGPRCWHFSRSL